MRLLITNDDGIDSEGIQVLARHLGAAGHNLVVVAPDHNYSGSGAALGDLRPDVPLAVRRVRFDEAPDIEAWALDGTPALTVVAARLGAFGDPPDFVVSGVNAGLNTGRSVLHSGTVGAVLTAQNFGLSGLAVSIDVSDPWHWDTAAAMAVEVVDQAAGWPDRSAVNLNVPACSRGEVRGLRWATLASFGAVRAAMSTRNDEEVVFESTASDHQPGEDTDQGAIQAGWATLTTLVGVAEAWPPDEPDRPEDGDVASGGLRVHIAPGADVHPVHQIPDASAEHWLRRPVGAP